MDYLRELNEVQFEAVRNAEGPIMIIAGAGSGKTRVLTFRIAFLIQHGIDPFNILSLTFTNKAAREMKERIGKVVGVSESKNLWMGTFHSVFSKILRIEAEKLNYPSNFTIYDTEDAKSVLKSIISEMGLDDKVYKPNLIYNRISSAKNSLITAQMYAEDRDLITSDQLANRPKTADIYKKYATRCFKSGAMDFDDLLLKTYELFKRYPDVLYKYQQRFKFIMVDEFQDTNHAQYLIIRQLSAMYRNICVVGDDAQSIYAFRGANIANILNFEKDYPDLKVFKLEQNYRSSSTIVEAANQIIANNKEQLEKKVWTDNDKGNKIKIFRAVTDNEEGMMIAREIFETQMNKQLRNDDFAILYRTNSQSRALEEALRKMNLPYRIYGGTSFYQRKEIKDLLAYFRMVINPNDDEALKRIINYPARGIGKTTLDKIITFAGENDISIWTLLDHLAQANIGLNAGTVKKIEEFKFSIKSFATMMYKKDAYDLAASIASASGLLKELYIDKTPEGVSRYENVQELLNGIKDFAENNRESENGNTLDKFMEDIALLTDADNEDEEDRNKISLMTIHSSKGLEFKNVFIAGLEENLFPSQLSVNSRSELEEERRLFYVAVTRAMDQVTFSHAQNRYRFGNLQQNDPSRFIAEIGEEHIEFVNSPTNSLLRHSTIPTFNRFAKPATNTNQYKPVNNPSVKTFSNAPKFSGDDPDKLQAGMRVAHSRFGEGIIQAIEGNTVNRTAVIEFDKDGQKKLLLKFAKLRIIS